MSQIIQLLKQAGVLLADAGDDNPRLVAELLLAHVLKKPRSWLYAWPESTIAADPEQQFLQRVIDRCNGTPVAYLTGTREFWSLPLRVSNATLIPRPETELLVETLLALGHAETTLTLLDMGTGSGAIAIAVASERQHWSITATDNSAAALQIAQKNTALLKECNIDFIHSDWFTDIATDQQWHIIVSNPPYIAAADLHLQQGDLRFEPRSALASGAQGLDDLRQIVQGAPGHLHDGGWLLVEHGMAQGDVTRALFHNQQFANISTLQDLQGHDRLTMGQK